MQSYKNDLNIIGLRAVYKKKRKKTWLIVISAFWEFNDKW